MTPSEEPKLLEVIDDLINEMPADGVEWRQLLRERQKAYDSQYLALKVLTAQEYRETYGLPGEFDKEPGLMPISPNSCVSRWKGLT